MNAREIVAWTIAGVAIAGFIAIDLFLLTTIVDRLIDVSNRVGVLECG